ncbi:MAG: glycerophosphodiester phosphodiesterase family protein [Eubacteriales bacterium]|nr:glycerophosphodiester phosphodiesterase family protein [Eubacteriales bacterium]
MKKRILAVLCAIIVIFPLFVIAPQAADNVEKIVTIAWNEPAIPVNAGQAVDLTKYNLGVSATETINASSLTWKNGTTAITSFTPSSAGVYTLTAVYGTTSKSVYVVAKNTADKDYVLYTNDFTGANPLSDWKKQIENDALIKVENSKLVIDARNYEMLRILLPEWLGEFGNYCITASVSSSDEKDTGRWNSIMYRVQNNNYPFYHMCVRKNTAASNGIEFALRNSNNLWNVINTGSYTTAQTTGTYYNYKVQVKDDVIMESFNEKDVIYNEDKKEYYVGRIGLQANYSIMYVDRVTVSLQLEKPDFDISQTLIETTATVENISNSFTNVVEITSAGAFNNLDNAVSAIIHTDGTSVTTPEGTVLDSLDNIYNLIGTNIIPVFYCKTKTAVDGVCALLADKTVVDAAVISDDATIVKYARTKKNTLRGIIDFRGKYSHELTADEISAVRLAVNGSLAKTALLDISCLSQSVTSELRELLLSVWAYDECATPEDAAAAIVLGAHGVVSPNPDNVKSAYSFFEGNTVTSTSLIIGHRGNPTNAPENSMSSYICAFENGADIVETDVYLTTDNEVVIMHDGTIDRTTDGSGNVESMTLAQLKTYHLWGDNDAYKTKLPDERIPTLRELFEYAKGKDLKVFVEIKSSKAIICKYIADLINEYEITDQVCVICFSITQCAEMQKYAPAVSCGYLISGTAQASTQRMANAALYAYLPSILANNTTLNPGYGSITKKLCDVANDRGVTIWPWTYTTGSATAFANAFIWGYGGLTTNDAQYTKNTVKYISTDLNDIYLMPDDTYDYTVSSATYGRVSADITNDASVKILSGDAVTVENGKITAVKAGTAKLMFYYGTKLPTNTAYTLYTKVITINVLSADEFGEIALLDNDRFTTDGSLISGAAIGTKAGEFLKHFKNTELKITRNGTQLADGDVIGTGCVVESYAGGVLKQSQTIVVKADLNGNGAIDTIDYISLRLMILGIGDYSEAQKAAADVNGNGTRNVTDYIMIRLHILGITAID